MVSMEELEANLKDETRAKIEACIDRGWKFDKKTWEESVARHKRWNMKEIFAQFDADGDGKLDIYEIARAFRALGLPKRDGEKMEMDKGASHLHLRLKPLHPLTPPLLSRFRHGC